MQDFNEHLDKSCTFQGHMNLMANSIDLLLGNILENINAKPHKMLGSKIKELEDNETILSPRHSGNFSELVQSLKNFNEHWNITKHGMVVGERELSDFTFYKDRRFHTFNQEMLKEIDSQFTQTMQDLTEIHNSLIDTPN